MIRLFTLISLALLSPLLIQAQCQPDPQYTEPGIYPDSATNLPHAFATYEYNAVFTAIIPADTMLLPGLTLRIDSIGVTDIQGLPAGFSAIPNRPSAFWHGGTSGCMLITGTPTEAQVGTYPLQITVVGYIGGLGLPNAFVIDYYSITVREAAVYGFSENHKNPLQLKSSPNPFRENTSVSFQAPETASYEIALFDLLGRKLGSEQIFATSGRVTHAPETVHLRQGTFICTVTNLKSGATSSIRIVKH